MLLSQEIQSWQIGDSCQVEPFPLNRTDSECHYPNEYFQDKLIKENIEKDNNHYSKTKPALFAFPYLKKLIQNLYDFRTSTLNI